MVTPPNDSPIYLSKDGNVAGPFNRSQIEELKKSGEYRTYSWFWDATSQNWAPINPPNKPPAGPPMPSASSSASDGNTKTSVTKTLTMPTSSTQAREITQNLQTPVPALPTSRPSSSNSTYGGGATAKGNTNTSLSQPRHPVGTQGHAPSIPGVPAICHNSRTIIAGKLSELSKDGCVFRSDESTRSLPDFLKGTKVRLNVLEESSGKSENLDAVILRLTLFEGHWEFHLSWDRAPVILEHLK